MTVSAFAAFQCVGIEIEYMIVADDDLRVLPIADRILQHEGVPCAEVARGALGWSNELVLHVLEVKNREPAASLAELAPAFAAEPGELERRLAPFGARLMPGAMHPWMNPREETRLWPHDNDAIYRAYHRIFDCCAHGWANLQSMHVNLPFRGDEEFARLHAAVRCVLPILPALAASSPFAEGRATGYADYRMQVYWNNAAAFPAITGEVIPENASSHAEYAMRILEPMYRAIVPLDPEQVLQHEWLNSRGAIARFDRSAIEIRVIDSQECPQADLAIAAAAIGAARMLYETGDLAAQQNLSTQALAKLLRACVRDGENAGIDNDDYLRLFGLGTGPRAAAKVWDALIDRLAAREPDWQQWARPLSTILAQGTLSTRLLRAAGASPSRERLAGIYRTLCDCLREGRQFMAD
ncbi:MAG TPA: glutamate-cysteine ligase family protein [Noviherbaspirillum sp.]|nr:glutamate-cysteine ligase family protein [Noviherbaspirillum sp.]